MMKSLGICGSQNGLKESQVCDWLYYPHEGTGRGRITSESSWAELVWDEGRETYKNRLVI